MKSEGVNCNGSVAMWHLVGCSKRNPAVIDRARTCLVRWRAYADREMRSRILETVYKVSILPKFPQQSWSLLDPCVERRSLKAPSISWRMAGTSINSTLPTRDRTNPATPQHQPSPIRRPFQDGSLGLCCSGM